MHYPHSLACDFDQVFDHIGPALIEPRHRARLRALAARLPSMGGGFECTLGQSGLSPDVCLRFTAAEPVGRMILADHAALRLPHDLATHPAWQRTARMMRDLPSTAVIWFEYDSAHFDDPVPTPNVIVESFGDDERAFTGIEHALASLDGSGVDAASIETVRTLLAELPPGSWVNEIGAMEARPGQPLRLRVEGLEAADLWDLVLRIGWPPNEAQARQLHGLKPLYPRLGATLDFAAGRLVKFGVPLPCTEAPNGPSTGMQMTACLTWLLGSGSCTPAEAVALRAWIGWNYDDRDTADFPHEFTPSECEAGLAVYRRGFSQFKLVFEASGATITKAYFGYYRRSMDRALAARLPIAGSAFQAAS